MPVTRCPARSAPEPTALNSRFRIRSPAPLQVLDFQGQSFAERLPFPTFRIGPRDGHRPQNGIARIASKPYPDTCQFDEKSDYFDPKSTKDAPRWVAVDVEALVKFPVIPVSILRAQPELADMLILRRGNRLSITPVEKKDFLFIVEHLAKPQS